MLQLLFNIYDLKQLIYFQIPANVEVKGDEIRLVRAFLTDTVKVSEATVQKVTRERLGSSSKPTRFQRGPLKRCTVLNISAVSEELVFRLRRGNDLLLYPLPTMFVSGYTVFTLSVQPLVCPLPFHSLIS